MAERQKVQQRQTSTPKKRMSKRKRQIIRRRRMIVLLGAVSLLVLLVAGSVSIVRHVWSGEIVSAHQLHQLGWKQHLSHEELEHLNDLMTKYEITSAPSVTMFFATAASETDAGRLVLEEGGDAYYESHGYNRNECGAGYLQITHREKQLEFLQAMGDPFQGSDTASYIAERYPWESACWLWSVGKTSPAPNPNTYAKNRGNTPEVFLATQYGINGWTISNDALGKIVQGVSYTLSEDGKCITVDGETAPVPRNWQNRLEWYNKAKRIWG